MKKDKEWLKESIKDSGLLSSAKLYDLIDQLDETEVKQLDKKIKELNSYNDELIRDNNQLRNELDNQEVLSQEFIDEHKYNHYIGKPFVYVDDLQKLIVPKQDKPIIPQFVADFIEERTNYEYGDKPKENSVYNFISNCHHDFQLGHYVEVSSWFHDSLENEIKLELAWLNGYEVEKEKKYYAKIKGHEIIQRIPTFDEDTGENTSDYYRSIYFVLQSDGDLIVDMKDSGLSGAKNVMTMSQWNNLGINETNADFEEVE